MPLPPLVLQDPMWARLDSGWKPIPKRPGYALGIAVVLTMTVLMALAYVATLAGLGYGAFAYFQHVDFPTASPSGRSAVGAFVLWVLPPAMAIVLIVVLIKPVFAPAAGATDSIEIKEFEELKLHSFVQNVCNVIGAPAPKEIRLDCDVNASASFRRGLLSLFKPDDLVLTIGMPLVAGMTKRQFAGVLAHEFGHFAQGTGMRTTYLALSLLNWFRRAAYQRDGWDVVMAGLARSGHAIAVLGWAAIICSWLARLVLIAIVWVCSLPALYMLRQMEYDADRYEVQMSGVAAFEQAFNVLGELGTVYPRALEATRRVYQRDKTVPNNFPAVLADHARRMTPEDRTEVAKQMLKAPGGAMSTHPSPSKRVAAAKAFGHEGLYSDEAPAAQLFGDFNAACTKASYHLFRQLLGPELEMAKFVSVAPLVVAGARHEAQQTMLQTFLGYEPASWRPPFLRATQIADAADAKAAVTRMLDAKAKSRRLADAGAAAKRIEDFRSASDDVIRWGQIAAQVGAGLSPDFKGLGLPFTSREGAMERLQQAGTRLDDASAKVDELNAAAAMRLSCTLAVLGVAGIESANPTAKRDRARADELLVVLETLRRIHPIAVEARSMSARAQALMGRVRNEESFKRARNELRPLSDIARIKLDDARRLGGDTKDPAAPSLAEGNLGATLVGASPGHREMDEIFAALEVFVANYPDAVRRCLGELAEIACRVEVGLAKKLKGAQSEETARA